MLKPVGMARDFWAPETREPHIAIQRSNGSTWPESQPLHGRMNSTLIFSYFGVGVCPATVRESRFEAQKRWGGCGCMAGCGGSTLLAYTNQSRSSALNKI